MCCYFFHPVRTNSGVLQVRSNFRTAITVPERAWNRMREVIGEYLDKIEEDGPTGSGDARPTTEAAAE